MKMRNNKIIINNTIYVIGIFYLLERLISLIAYGLISMIVSNDDNGRIIADIVSATVILIYYFKTGTPDAQRVETNIKSSHVSSKKILITVLIGVTYNSFFFLFVSGILNLLGDEMPSLGKDLEGAIILNIVLICFFGPVLEEIAFRGVLFAEIRKIKKYWFAAIYTSVCFSLLHLDIIGFINYFISGLIFAYVWEKGQNIKLNIFLHSTMNVIGVSVRILDKQAALLMNYSYILDFFLATVCMVVFVMCIRVFKYEVDSEGSKE